MSEIADRYRRLAAEFRRTIAAVAPDRWEDASPCEEWSAREVVRHVVNSQGLFLGFVGQSAPEGPSVDDDPVGAFDAASAAMQAEIDDPERAAVEFEGFLGRQRLDEAVNRFLCTDLVIHRWDVATATGQEVELDRQEMARVRKEAKAFEHLMRGQGAFGPAVETAPDADEQTAFLAFFGRHA